jgi:hypothetical protein
VKGKKTLGTRGTFPDEKLTKPSVVPVIVPGAKALIAVRKPVAAVVSAVISPPLSSKSPEASEFDTPLM